MKQSEIIKAIGCTANEYTQGHAKQLAAVYSFIKKEIENISNVRSEPATVMLGRKSEWNERLGAMDTKNKGEEVPAEKIMFSIGTGSYSFCVPSGNTFHTLVCETLGLQSQLPAVVVEKQVIHTYHIEAPIANAISRAKNFVTKDDLRPKLQCVCIEISENRVQVLATDCHRLFMSKVYSSISGPKKFKRYLIPADQIKKIPVVKEGSFEFIVYGDNSVSFLGTTYKLHENDDFVDWRVVVPEYKKRMIVDREDLISCVKQLIPYTNKSTTQVNFGVTSEIHISGEDVDFSFESGLRLAYSKKEMDDFVIGFNGKFLLTILAAFKTQWVSMYTDGRKDRAACFTDGTDTILMMPLINLADINDYYPKDVRAITAEPVLKSERAPDPEPVEEPVKDDPILIGREGKAARVFSEFVDWLCRNKAAVGVKCEESEMMIRYTYISGGKVVRGSKRVVLDQALKTCVIPAVEVIMEGYGKKVVRVAA